MPEKWTEIEHLPEWDEEFYHVYTAKKHGKWLMLKTLRPEFKDDPKMQSMLEKEFDVRYNLAHSNIIMINDLEEIPGLGKCIITDDVYGKSLRKLIDEGELRSFHIDRLVKQGVDALEYIQENHLAHQPLKPERIIFTENIGNLKLIDVGFEQRKQLSHGDTSQDIYNFGKVLEEALEHVPRGLEGIPTSHYNLLKKVAERCTNPQPSKRYHNIQALRLALSNKSTNRIYIVVIIVLLIMIGILIWILRAHLPHMTNF